MRELGPDLGDATQHVSQPVHARKVSGDSLDAEGEADQAVIKKEKKKRKEQKKGVGSVRAGTPSSLLLSSLELSDTTIYEP